MSCFEIDLVEFKEGTKYAGQKGVLADWNDQQVFLFLLDGTYLGHWDAVGMPDEDDGSDDWRFFKDHACHLIEIPDNHEVKKQLQAVADFCHAMSGKPYVIGEGSKRVPEYRAMEVERQEQARRFREELRRQGSTWIAFYEATDLGPEDDPAATLETEDEHTPEIDDGVVNRHTVEVCGQVSVDLKIYVIDPSWDIQRVVSALKGCKTDGFNPLYELPTTDGEWTGDIRVGGSVVARYDIWEADYAGDVTGCYDDDGTLIEMEEPMSDEGEVA